MRLLDRKGIGANLWQFNLYQRAHKPHFLFAYWGVMITLALVPSATIAGMALIAGEIELAVKALLRWAIEAGFVFALLVVVLGWKQAHVYQRRMML